MKLNIRGTENIPSSYSSRNFNYCLRLWLLVRGQEWINQTTTSDTISNSKEQVTSTDGSWNNVNGITTSDTTSRSIFQVNGKDLYTDFNFDKLCIDQQVTIDVMPNGSFNVDADNVRCPNTDDIAQSTRNGELDFHPTPEFPALQYLDSVDPSSRADRAGLKPGDFILEINGENVVRASHDRVVQVIRNSGDTLAMKVVTVRPQQNPVNWQHMDGTMTLPSRATSSASASKKQAPQPPRRDPRTSLSKEKGRQIAEGLSELDQLDLALAEFERENLEQHNVSTEQKTASIRAKHASKRVSCVDLSNIEGYDSEKSDHRSPSERIIHKYNTERKQSAMERSQSTPDLSDKKPEPVYATPVVPGSAGVQRRNDGTYVYAVPEDSLSMKSSTSTSERPKGPPPPPPGALGFKRPAPGVPKDEVVVQPANAEVVSINTIGSRTSLYARPEKDFNSSTR
ncbi:SHANK [Mytilus edulis]|uniref:SHANK n=1 Tax=Mytilus edulis TaxID=6550 RepID=A0A8S3UIP5_MYTED|nr:SHANK [Mytilus edulis]